MSTQHDVLVHSLDPVTFVSSDWKLDSAHTSVQFSVRHMIGRATGTFQNANGVLHQGAADLTGSSLEISIDATTINTNNADRDNHLRSAEFFDVEKFPQIIFVGKEFIRTGEETFDVKGQLSIHGHTHDVVLNVIDGGRATDPWGQVKAGFHATTSVHRHDYDLRYNATLEAGGVMLGENVMLTLDAQFVWQGTGTGN